jgi:hypothetical protein
VRLNNDYSLNLCISVLSICTATVTKNICEMANCGVCVKPVGQRKFSVSCSDCNKVFHAGCVNMSKADIDCLTSEKLPWRCLSCSKVRRQSMMLDVTAEDGKLTLKDIMDSISEIKDTQRSMEKDFNNSYELLQEQLKENTEALKAANEKNDQYLKLINDLVADNAKLKKRVQELENQQDDLEQYSRINSVEIHGIPHSKNENVLTVVKEVGKALDFNITDEMVDACHRLGRGANASAPPGIIVKFVRRMDKEELMRLRRVKRTLSTRHLGLSMDQPIYMNDSLTRKRRQLFNATRNVRKDKHYKYMWVRNGNIFLRKDDGEKVIQINSDTDLNNL